MPEQFKPQSQEGNPENLTKQERFENLCKVFDNAEIVFAVEGREAAKPLLSKIYDDLIALNKRDKKDWQNIWIWNQSGYLSEEEFNSLNFRRKKLSNAIGIMTDSGEVRHDLNEI